MSEAGDESEAPRPSTPKPEITTDKAWSDSTEGDFEVITSDNVRFLVPSYMLLGARRVPRPASIPRDMLTSSALFRDADKHASTSSPAPARSLHLLDPTIETAPVFRHFLDLIEEGAFEDNYWLSHIHLLDAFFRKWDCHVANVLLLLQVVDMAICHNASPLRAWAIGACAENRQVCARVLTHCSFMAAKALEVPAEIAQAWSTHGEAGCLLDPTVWPMYMWTDVPSAWAMALARTYGSHRHLLNTGRKGMEMYTTGFLEWLDKLEAAEPTHVAFAKVGSRFDKIVPAQQ